MDRVRILEPVLLARLMAVYRASSTSSEPSVTSVTLVGKPFVISHPSSVSVLHPRELQPHPNPLANVAKYDWLRVELFVRGFV